MHLPTSSAASLLVWFSLLCVVQAWWPNLSPHPTRRPRMGGQLFSLRGDDDTSAAEQLRQQAAKLREEVDAFEQRKQETAATEQRKIDEARTAAVAQRARYSAIVPILKPDGSTVEERCDFSPRLRDGSSFITTCEAALPLGIMLGESEDLAGCIVIDEAAPGSNGDKAGLQKGDIVRAFTACQMTMETPTWQLMAGGIGIPKTTRFMYSVDNRPFEEVMSAVASNRQDPQQRPMVIVVERKGDSTE